MSWRDQYVEDGDSQTSTVAAPEQRDWRETFVEGGSEGQAQREAQRKARKARERFQRDRELFNDPNAVFSGLPETSRANLEQQIQDSFDPEGAKIRLANIQYLADVYDKDSEEVARNLGRYRQDFLLQKMEHPRPADVDDKEFYGLVGKELESEEQKMDFTEQYLQRIQKRAVREGGTFTEAHRETMEELAEHEGFDSRALDKYMQVGMETYAEASEMFEPYREQINSLFQYIGQEEEFLLTGTMEEDAQTVLDQLERLSPEERQNVYFAVREKAEEHDVDIGGFFKKTAEAFGRGATNIAKGHVRNLTGQKISDARERFSTVDKIYVPEDVPDSATEDPDEYAAWLMLHAQSDSLQAVFARAGLVNYREVTPEEREIVQQKAERFEKEEMIASELRNLVEREINPVEGEGGVLGTAADKIWYPFVENVPFTAEFLIPVAGIPLGVSSIVDMRREEIMQRNPEMDRRQAHGMALFGSPFELVSELLQVRMMVGKAGPLGKAFRTPATGGLSGAKRAALDLGLRTADMNIQEGLQDMTPLVVQELTSYLNDEVPGIDWEKEMGEFGKERFDVFWATLPMVLIGTGAAKFRDAREQRAHLNDMLRLEMVGIGREKAREIVAETDFDRKNQLYEEAFAERDQGVSMDAVLRAETQQAEMAYMQDSDQATTIVARGDRNFDVEAPDGTVLGSANSFEAARALAAQKRSEEAAGTEQAVTDMMDYFEDLREDGVILERQDVERLLQEDIDEGRISEAEAYERIRIAGMNMGEDFSDMTPADVQVFGRNQREFREKVEVDVVSIYNGADPLDVVEEHSEVHIKRAVEQGRVGWDQVQAWKDAFEDATGEVTHDNSEASLVEWFSERAKDYIVGRNKDVPPSFRSFLNQMREYVAHVMRRAATMMKLERDGKLDGDFRTELRRAVGLDRQFAEANRRERMAREDQAGFDQTTDRDPASEVQRAVKGKLPHPEVARAKGDPMAGELQDLYDAMTRRVQVTRKDGTTYTRRDPAAARAFFAKKTDPYKGIDQVREGLVDEFGFDFETSANMIEAVEASLKGQEQFPTFSGQPSFSMGAERAVRPGDDFQVTIQQRQGNVPGYIQVDLIRDGENVASGNLESFRSEGVNIPDVPDWVPQGRYTLDELRETIEQGPNRDPDGGQEEVIGISYSLRPKGKKYPGPAVGKIDPRLPDHEMTKGDRTYVIKSLTQWDEFLTRTFKSATEVLREGGFGELATAIETNFDTRQKRLGYIQNRMENFIRDNLTPLDRKARREAYAAFREYMAARENSKVREHQADSLFEQARAKRKAEQAAALWKKMPAVSRKMVELTDRVGRETGDVNRTLVQPDGTRGIQIKDPETKKWRVIGKVKHFWPRTFKREVQQAINDTERHKVLWEKLVDALMAEGYITDRDEAKRYLNTNAPTLTENSSFAGVEQARQVQLPEIFYDYSFDAMIGYGTKWAARTSQIENFGQADYLKDKGMDGDLFDQYRKRATGTTVTYLQAARDRVYGVQVNDFWHNLMANGNILATGLMLGNPATAFGLNLPGGMGLNYQAYGIGNATKGFVDTIVNWKEHKKAAEDSGILINDLYSLMNDYENVDTKVFGLDVTEGLKTFTKLTLRYGGYLPTERFIRTHAMVTGKHFLLNAKKEWNENPDGYKARQYRKFFERNHFDIGKLRRDDAAEFERWLRYAANLTQGSYKVDQTPVWIDQPIGRVLFKYQKFQTQVTRLAWNEAFKPFAEAVANGNGRDRAAAFLPILNYFASAFVAGQVIGSVREAVFGYIRPGPDMDEVEKALEDDKRANALNLIVNRAMHNYLAAGTFGLFGNYGQMAYDIMDQQRVKNPLDPPILAAPKGMFEFVLRYVEQGKLTARDFDDITANVFSIYRTTKRAGLRGLLLVGSELNEVEVQAAKTDIYWTRQRVRRFEQETDIGRKMTFAGRFSKNEMSPVNTKIYEAILTGDPGKASEIAREYLRTLETAEERENAKRSMRSSIRAREPVRVGQVTSAEDRRAFLKWAEEKLSAGDYERIRRTDENYRRTARRAGLM